MIDALVLSTPRSGTRFYLYFLREILGIDAGYAHFGFTSDERILELVAKAKVVIVVKRPLAQLRESWNGKRAEEMEASIKAAERLRPTLHQRGALVMDIEKGAQASRQFGALLLALKIGWSAEAITFFDEWPVIGSRHTNINTLDQLALASALLARL